jgi:5'-3' exonuclease
VTKLVLLDGYSLAYRAFYALPADLATPSGTFTNAVYGFTSMLTKLYGDEHPDQIAVVFDAPNGSASRRAVDPEYKANRLETPELFSAQVPLIHEVLDALAIPDIVVPGVEADDVIATLAGQAAEAGIDVIVVTGDRDSYRCGVTRATTWPASPASARRRPPSSSTPTARSRASSSTSTSCRPSRRRRSARPRSACCATAR